MFGFKLGVILVASASVMASDYTIASLGPDDWVDVRFMSTGCFHSSRAWFKVKPGDVVTAELRDESGAELGSVDLSAADVVALDRLVAYYRGLKDDGACTTESTVTLVWLGPRIKGHVEPFVDATCAAPREGRAVLGRLSDLSRELGERPSN